MAVAGLFAGALSANAAVSYGILDSSVQGAGNTADVFASEAVYGTDWGVPTTGSITSITPPPGAVPGEFKSPWVNTAESELVSASYFSVGGSSEPSPQTVMFDTALTGIKLLWGSIDIYNWIVFNEGAADEATVTGTDILTALGDPLDAGPEQVALVNFWGSIDSMTFYSASPTGTDYPAFEFAVSTVPLPAGVLLMGLGLAGMGGARVAQKRRKSA
ncbi:VPLPA-CTERM sorting domain-containing protein [Tropicimonas sp. TH_r6]|uniref:Npun_F0296 family exosortase-dependent surface protein n=1 Tax=Tropicimonas sp. TH_r6 TaxID=3082085 RepID=UPI002955B709|nr:VPLPA-CTERM sorting domain-containing protein [Tropicimonas sp. TH_r6]MDV7145532.1 VPLPA-CTERM sorting domain-containing protein [Tropicimonas sp. TH_r6]